MSPVTYLESPAQDARRHTGQLLPTYKYHFPQTAMASIEGYKTLVERVFSQRPWLVATTASGAVALAVFTRWCVRDYREYLALGPGGPPYNVAGWAAVTFLVRPFALSRSDVTRVDDYPAEGSSLEIRNLPRRQGERALVGGIAPHRQLSQHAPEHMRPVSFAVETG